MRFWCWLNENASALQVLGGLTSLIVTVPLLIWTGRVARRAAKASEDQAAAATAQVAAAEASSRLSELQLAAAQEAAAAEREHSRLINQQILVNLQPVLVAAWGDGDDPKLYLLNQSSTGVAMSVRGSWIDPHGPRYELKLSLNVLGPGAKIRIFGLARNRSEGSNLEVFYDSVDKRSFTTRATLGGEVVLQSISESVT